MVLNLFLFKIWKDYVYDVWDYGYGSITWKYRFHTYEECLEYLTKNIEDKESAKQKDEIDSLKEEIDKLKMHIHE